MGMRKIGILVGLVAFVIAATFGGSLSAVAAPSDDENEEAEQWEPTYMTENYDQVGAPSVSPDGEMIAYTVSEPQTEGEKSEYLTHIHIVTSDGERDYQLTRGEESASNPKWAPDGEHLAFTSARGEGNENQIWIIDPRGGEAWPLTETETSIVDYAWAPDGDHIAFLMQDPLTEEEERRQRERRDMEVVGEDFRYAHLYTMDLAELDQEADGAYPVQRLTEGEFHVNSFDWSPDTETIVFDHQPTPRVNDWMHASISKVPADSGAVTEIVDEGRTPHFSPEGEQIAFVADVGEPGWPSAHDLHVTDPDGDDRQRLDVTFDRQPNLQGWSADGERLLYSESHRTSHRLFSIPVDGGSYEIITEGDGHFSGFSLTEDKRSVAAVHQDFHESPNVVFSDIEEFNPERLTSVNEGYEEFPMGEAEVITYESTDGYEIEAPLIYPTDYEPGEEYPVLLHVHGGPAGVYGETYSAASSVYPLQAFAAEGYFVLRPNFRGSSGYGEEFRSANVADWGFGDFEDLMAGVDHLIDEGKAASDSLAIMGWSYGGYMSSFAVTRTDRFQASMVGAGVTSLPSFTGTTDIPSFIPDYFEAELWEDDELYRRHSALFNVEEIETPTLILHPEEDVRVPPSQGHELYTALDRRGIETKLVLYPRQPHGLQEPKFIIDAAERQLEWLDRHLRGNAEDPAD